MRWAGPSSQEKYRIIKRLMPGRKKMVSEQVFESTQDFILSSGICGLEVTSPFGPPSSSAKDIKPDIRDTAKGAR